jgi:hypothetical protein
MEREVAGDPRRGCGSATGAHIGKAVQLRVHRPSADERKLIAAFNADKMIRGIYLQPDPPTLFDGTLSALLFLRSTGDTPAIVQRLAQHIGVDFRARDLRLLAPHPPYARAG